MIYTVTLNPAIDYVVHLQSPLEAGKLNRSAEEEAQPGGKGINVSSVLRNLEEETVALGFTAGFTGQGLEEGLRSQGLTVDFVHVREGFTRINVKVKASAGVAADGERLEEDSEDGSDRKMEETEINGSGPLIREEELAALIRKLKTAEEGDTVVMAGSIPKGVPADIYADLADMLGKKHVRTVVDTTGERLLKTLPYHPFLIKPNHHELSEIFNVRLPSEGELTEFVSIYARELWSQGQEPGARNVLVSMGSKGAFLLDENGETHVIGCVGGRPVNTVGAGDSMVAGFLHGCLRSLESSGAIDYEEALLWGTAAGGATASSLGLASRERIDELMKELKAEEENDPSGYIK